MAAIDRFDEALDDATADMDELSLNAYQFLSSRTAVYRSSVPRERHEEYLLLGLVGEAGELANGAKKVLRGQHGDPEYPAFRQTAKGELGDILWYLAQLAWRLGYSLEDVAQSNLRKLSARKAKGTIGGEGENR